MARFLRILPALAIGLLALSGCEEDIDPFIEGDVYFSMYGALDTAVDTQFVRVIPITQMVSDGDTRVSGAVVRSVRLADGNVVTWRDSTVTFADGTIGTVFYAPLRVYPGFSYRIEVERADGAMTSAQTNVPAPETAVQVGAPSGRSRQIVRWPGVEEEPFRVEVWYRFLNADPRRPFSDVVITYNERNQREVGDPVRNGDGWEVEVQLGGDFDLVRDQLSFRTEDPPTLLAVGMRLAQRDDQWVPPGGAFSTEVLVQPGLFSNVENGFGFIGSINNAAVEWTLPQSVVQTLGYAFPQ